eukprot:IDg14195t1
MKSPARRALASDGGAFTIAIVAFVGLVCFDGAIPVLHPMVDEVPTRVALHGVRDDAHGSLIRTRQSFPQVVTLHYKLPWDTATVTHNCLQAARAGAAMLVYTQNLSSTYCDIGSCQCESFLPTRCSAPNRTAGAVNHCEKLAFLSYVIP